MYNKLFTKILDSSIWLEPLPTRIVWITLLAAMDEEGYAHFSAVENLASRARVTVTQCNAAIKTLAEPDQNSCDPEYSGRRIERVPGGFIILNAPKYRAIANNASRRESTRLRVQRFREKNSDKEPERERNADVTPQTLHPASPSPSVSASELVGGAGGNQYPPEAVIPTAKEIADYCSVGLGIPADYAEHYHAQCEIKNRWLSANGHLIQWRTEIARWWSKDRATWNQRKKNGNAYSAEKPNPRNSGIGGDRAKRTAAVVARVAAMQKEHEQP